MNLDFILIVAAVVSFLCAAFGVNARVQWQPLAFAFLALTLLT